MKKSFSSLALPPLQKTTPRFFLWQGVARPVGLFSLVRSCQKAMFPRRKPNGIKGERLDTSSTTFGGPPSPAGEGSEKSCFRERSVRVFKSDHEINFTLQPIIKQSLFSPKVALPRAFPSGGRGTASAVDEVSKRSLTIPLGFLLGGTAFRSLPCVMGSGAFLSNFAPLTITQGSFFAQKRSGEFRRSKFFVWGRSCFTTPWGRHYTN